MVQYEYQLYRKGCLIMPSPKDTNGPIVKTGPTSGENRTRKSSGEWRKKRSDAGQKRK